MSGVERAKLLAWNVARHPLNGSCQPSHEAELRAQPHYLRERHAFHACATRSTLRAPRVLVMVGDSTMRKQFRALCMVLDGPGLRCNDAGSAHWRRACVATGSLPCQSCAGRLGDAHLLALYYLQPLLNPNALDAVRDAVHAGAPRPDAIYFGAGMWLLWKTYSVNFNEAERRMWISWPKFVRYEAELVETIGRYARHAPRIVIHTAHSMCESSSRQPRSPWDWLRERVSRESEQLRRGFGVFRSAIFGAPRGPVPAAEPDRSAEYAECVHELVADPNGTADRHRAAELCYVGRRSARSLHALSLRARDVAIQQQLRSHRSNASKSAWGHVAVVDGFAITDGQCWANLKGDSIHFERLVYRELTGLFRALGWWCASTRIDVSK